MVIVMRIQAETKGDMHRAIQDILRRVQAGEPESNGGSKEFQGQDPAFQGTKYVYTVRIEER